MRALAIVLLTLAACDDGLETYGDDVDDLQVPPRGIDDFLTWAEQGHYNAWHCEPEPHPARPRGAHGTNRICTNDALSTATGEGPYPVGAAAVKEVFDDDGGIKLFAVYRKVTPDSGGDSWYWFEGSRDRVVANGEAQSICTGCHGGAPRDFVFTVVP